MPALMTLAIVGTLWMVARNRAFEAKCGRGGFAPAPPDQIDESAPSEPPSHAPDVFVGGHDEQAEALP